MGVVDRWESLAVGSRWPLGVVGRWELGVVGSWALGIELRSSPRSGRLRAHRLEELHHAIDGETSCGRRTKHLHHRAVLILDFQEPAFLCLEDVKAGRTRRYRGRHGVVRRKRCTDRNPVHFCEVLGNIGRIRVGSLNASAVGLSDLSIGQPRRHSARAVSWKLRPARSMMATAGNDTRSSAYSASGPRSS